VLCGEPFDCGVEGLAKLHESISPRKEKVKSQKSNCRSENLKNQRRWAILQRPQSGSKAQQLRDQADDER
jgi:hypothetical protein